MNDPHVEALSYKLMHGETVDYEKAPPLLHREPGFTIRVADGKAQIEMIDHYATVEAARAAVEPTLHAWALKALLDLGPGELDFTYDRARIIDRDPVPGKADAALFVNVNVALDAIAQVGRAKYPAPPAGIACDADVAWMAARYRLYREGGALLHDPANCCLTTLERRAGDRRRAAQRYGIAYSVLKRLGELLANKGGPEARKASGAEIPFTSAERRWIDAVCKAIISRAAEMAFNPNVVQPKITMSDLPRL